MPGYETPILTVPMVGLPCKTWVNRVNLLIALLVTEMIVAILRLASYVRLPLRKDLTLGFRSLTEPSTFEGALITCGAGCFECGSSTTSPAMILLTLARLKKFVSLSFVVVYLEVANVGFVKLILLSAIWGLATVWSWCV